MYLYINVNILRGNKIQMFFFNCIGMWWIDANLLYMNWRVNVGTLCGADRGLVWNIAALYWTMIHAYTHWEPNVGHVLRVTFPVYTSDTEHWLLSLSLFWADLWASALESVFRQVSFIVAVCFCLFKGCLIKWYINITCKRIWYKFLMFRGFNLY